LNAISLCSADDLSSALVHMPREVPNYYSDSSSSCSDSSEPLEASHQARPSAEAKLPLAAPSSSLADLSVPLPTPIDMEGVCVVETVPVNQALTQDLSAFWTNLSLNDTRACTPDDTGNDSTPDNCGSDGSSSPSSSGGGGNKSSKKRKASPSDQWTERFAELVQYKAKYGHCSVPYSWSRNRPLSQWVKRQRHQCKLKSEGKHSNLNDKREAMLQQLGFVWDSRAANWDERFEELRAFQQEFGHCQVTKTNPKYRPLAVWLKRQRHYSRLFIAGDRTTGMTNDRMSKLVELGVKLNLPAVARQTKV